MLKIMVPAGAAAFLLALAATNPSEDAHTRAMVEHARGTCGDAQLVKGLCGGIASLAAGLSLHYEDHLLYSTAELGDIRTLGLLGRVMVISG